MANYALCRTKGEDEMSLFVSHKDIVDILTMIINYRGKLSAFESKVTTFDIVSCTCARRNKASTFQLLGMTIKLS